MTDKYQRLRDALAAGPTPGPWFQSYRKSVYGGYRTEVYTADGEVVATVAWYPRKLNDTTTTTDREPNARLIAAASPDTIAALLDERDRLHAALVIARDYVADEIAYLKNAFRGHEEHGKVPDAEADLAQIDAALATLDDDK